VDGREEARLLELGSPFYWDWTADSSQILIHTGFGAGTARLSLLDVASGRGGPNAAVPGSFQAPDISRDGRYWAYAELDENGSSWLVAAEAATGAVERQRHAGLVAFSWSPAAEQLAFISGSERQLNFAGPLRLLDMTTGETSLLGQELVVAFFWSPDGRYLAAITTDERPGGVIAEGNGRRRLSKPTQQHPAITLSLFVIDVAAGEKRYLTEFEPTLTFITQFLPYFDQYALSHRLWSPASDALVLPAREDDADHILIVPINGDPPRQLATGDMPFWSQY
jgi:TolB protein